jgi:hypothetical protein
MRYLAEFYLPGSDSDLAGLARRARAGARGASGGDGAVRFLSAIYLADDESCFAIYEAPSRDLVQAAGMLAGLDFDHITPISVCEAEPDGTSP